LYAEGQDQLLTVDWSQNDGPGILVRFRELPDRESVEILRDSYLEALVTSDARPEGSWYWHEVIGATVATSMGERLGSVTDIFRTGGSEVFVVEGDRGEILVPAVSAVMVEFLPAEGRIVVDPEALALDEPEPRSRLRGRRTTRARKDRERGIVAHPGDGDAAPSDPSPGTEAVDPPAT
jgi:16S rRNA processing protein RimM